MARMGLRLQACGTLSEGHLWGLGVVGVFRKSLFLFVQESSQHQRYVAYLKQQLPNLFNSLDTFQWRMMKQVGTDSFLGPKSFGFQLVWFFLLIFSFNFRFFTALFLGREFLNFLKRKNQTNLLCSLCPRLAAECQDHFSPVCRTFPRGPLSQLPFALSCTPDLASKSNYFFFRLLQACQPPCSVGRSFLFRSHTTDARTTPASTRPPLPASARSSQADQDSQRPGNGPISDPENWQKCRCCSTTRAVQIEIEPL